ncbi:hypothetical protein AM1_D0130 (plasmid) [Acaryochloris marina MBIC11017]|uniref:Uncharacterized protein n=1 Tax=Acaryochloris marina (strain MBIC 11017) TaxID=329726 RepID=A8ZNN9_ACAM1|nr:hypothetical protein AM1_D0130 [Acaryochloris marina MBIC11017]
MEVLTEALDGLETHISIDLQGVCSLQTFCLVLPKAASRTNSIENSSI